MFSLFSAGSDRDVSCLHVKCPAWCRSFVNKIEMCWRSLKISWELFSGSGAFMRGLTDGQTGCSTSIFATLGCDTQCHKCRCSPETRPSRWDEYTVRNQRKTTLGNNPKVITSYCIPGGSLESHIQHMNLSYSGTRTMATHRALNTSQKSRTIKFFGSCFLKKK